MSTDRFHAILDDARSVMLTTLQSDDSLHARPMSPAGRDGATVWFLTSRDSGKAGEIRSEGSASITVQGDRTWLAADGRARLVDDQTKIDELWAEPMRAWFPDGPDSPDVVAVAVDLTEGEYWDVSGGSILSYVAGMAKALITGDQIDEDSAGDHAHVTF